MTVISKISCCFVIILFLFNWIEGVVSLIFLEAESTAGNKFSTSSKKKASAHTDVNNQSCFKLTGKRF